MATSTADEIAERLLHATLGLVDTLAVYFGDRLGWYRSLVEHGPATPRQLAERTNTSPRYAREWLEQQAVTGLLDLDRDGAPDERVYSISPAAAEVLTDEHSLNYLAPLGRMFMAVGPVLPRILEAHRTVRNNEELWMHSLTGICRREDIGPGNTILSKDILHLNVEKRETGHMRDSYKRGWFWRWFDTLNPF